MILETYAPESSCQSQIICKDLQHSSRSWTRRGGHSRSCHPPLERAACPWEQTCSVEDHSSIPVGVVVEIHILGSACCHHPTQATSESPMVGPNPAVGIGCPGFIVTLPLFADAVAFSAHHCAIFWSRSTSVPSNSSFVSGC